MTDVLVTDNFLDAPEFARIQEIILAEDFPWYFNMRVLNGISLSTEQFQFTHIFYYENRECSSYIRLLDPIVERLNALSVVRIKANLNTYMGQRLIHGFHTDYTDPRITTAVFYVDSNDGATIFSDGTEVESVANRVALFPCNTAHSGSTPSDSSRRCVINFNFIAA